MCDTQQDNPLGLKKIERVVTGCVKQTINAHGPIGKELIGSASKRITNQFFAYLKLYVKQKHLDKFQLQVVEDSELEVKQIQAENIRLKKQVAKLGDSLRQIRDGEHLDPSEAAKEAILSSRSIAKEKAF